MEVRAGVDAQLLVLRRGAHVALGVAAQMHREAAPVADAVERHRDLVPARAALAPELGVEVVAHDVPQHVVVERVGVVAARPPEQVVRGRAVSHQLRDEAHREDAAVIGLVAILVGAAFPRHDRLQRRRLQVRRRATGTPRDTRCRACRRCPSTTALRDPFDRVVGVDALPGTSSAPICRATCPSRAHRRARSA